MGVIYQSLDNWAPRWVMGGTGQFCASGLTAWGSFDSKSNQLNSMSRNRPICWVIVNLRQAKTLILREIGHFTLKNMRCGLCVSMVRFACFALLIIVEHCKRAIEFNVLASTATTTEITTMCFGGWYLDVSLKYNPQYNTISLVGCPLTLAR